MEGIIKFLYEWQTLVGSIMGGIFALLVALVVGHIVRRREEISSAILVIGDLTNVRIAFETLMDLGKNQNISEEYYPVWFAGKLSESFPRLSPMFESSAIRMMPISSFLAAHLALFHKIYTGIEIRINRMSEDLKLIKLGGSPSSTEQRKADINLIYKHFPYIVQHANCAEHLISELILSKMSTWHRIKQAIWPSTEEKKCMKYLKEGGS